MYIIAEAGVNHNGDLNLAKKLIEIAKEADANAIKFQAAIPNLVCIKDSPLAKYQKQKNSPYTDQLDMISKLHLKLDSFLILKEYADKLNIDFMCSAFDLNSLEFINKLVTVHKIPSGEINHYPYLKQIAQYKKKTILSTGMSNLNEVDNAIKVLCENGLSKKNIVLMHCTTQYPTNFSDVNLNAVKTLQETFKCQIGYSDHTIGNEVSIAALGSGCSYFEKHFTIDKNLEGPDHKASLSVPELKNYVRILKKVNLALGSREKKATNIEILNKKIVRRSIVANGIIKKGDIFTSQNVICKRPEIGIDPMEWPNLIGKKANKEYFPDEPIQTP